MLEVKNMVCPFEVGRTYKFETKKRVPNTNAEEFEGVFEKEYPNHYFFRDLKHRWITYTVSKVNIALKLYKIGRKQL